jgi:hypothetical protein
LGWLLFVTDCPECQSVGSKVGLITLVQHIKREFQKHIKRDSAYLFCRSKNCDVVYYSSSNDFVFEKQHLIVKVGQKEANGPVQVCYCFDYWVSDIEKEINETAKSTASQDIGQKIKAGLCACEIRNPQGSCCLGNVRAVEKQLKKK